MSFHISEEDNALIDKEMQGLVHLGILKQNMSPYFSPIMLIARKNSHLTKIITDFRSLMCILQNGKFDISIIRDICSVLGSSRHDCLSVLDLKDACNAIKLSESPKPLHGILAYFASASYVCQKMPMGLSSISTAI